MVQDWAHHRQENSLVFILLLLNIAKLLCKLLDGVFICAVLHLKIYNRLSVLDAWRW